MTRERETKNQCGRQDWIKNELTGREIDSLFDFTRFTGRYISIYLLQDKKIIKRFIIVKGNCVIEVDIVQKLIKFGREIIFILLESYVQL